MPRGQRYDALSEIVREIRTRNGHQFIEIRGATVSRMTAEKRKAEFLAKAKEAEKHAEETKDEASKSSWLRIAAGYHDLAARQGGANKTNT